MRLYPNPIFRKVIIPWYDSDVSCICMICAMVLVFSFGMCGISVCLDNDAYRDHIGVPLTLIILSGLVILSAVVRLVRRYLFNVRNRNDMP